MVNADPRHGPSSLLIAFIVVSLVTITLPTAPVSAQDPELYTLSGAVTDDAGNAIAGANLTLVPDNESADKRETATDEDGRYEFAGLGPGNYSLFAEHACCADGHKTVAFQGIEFSKTLDLKLVRQASPGERVTLSGVVTNGQGGAPVAGATIEINSWFEPSNEERTNDTTIMAPEPMPPRQGHERLVVTSDQNGRYSADLLEGRVELVVDAKGYDILNAWFDLHEDRSMDLPLRESEGTYATLTGVVRSSDGGPIQNANVNVWREWTSECDGDVCVARAGGGSDGSSGPTVEGADYYHRPRSDTNGWDSTGPDGRWTVTVQPGRIHLNVYANNHVGHEQVLTVVAGEEREVPITLDRIPSASVRIHGQAIDATSGEPVPYAQVNGQNQRWGTWNWSQADQNGNFELFIQPGYTIVEVSAYKWYWLQNCNGQPVPLTAESSAEASDERAASMVVEPHHRSCNQERDHEYFARVFTFSGEANSARELDAALKRLPAPDALFQGWVIDAQTQEGVPDVRVSFQNQFTHEWGEAVTDADGSFKIPVRAGYYTVRTWAEGYYDAAVNEEIASGQERTITLAIEAGERAQGHCCIAYAESGVAMDRAASAPPSGAPMAREESASSTGASKLAAGSDAADGEASQQAAGAAQGTQAFQGSGGGLGPYDASATGDQEIGDASEAPSAGVLLIGLALVGAALVLRRRR